MTLLAFGSLCDSPALGTFAFVSEDGFNFTGPVPVQEVSLTEGTVLVGENGALAYHGYHRYHRDGDAITIEPINLSALGVSCE